MTRPGQQPEPTETDRKKEAERKRQSKNTFPKKVVEHVSNVLESVEDGDVEYVHVEYGHVENMPHFRFGLLSESS
jgi:ribosomal protein L21E